MKFKNPIFHFALDKAEKYAQEQFKKTKVKQSVFFEWGADFPKPVFVRPSKSMVPGFYLYKEIG